MRNKTVVLVIFLLMMFFVGSENTLAYLFDKTSPITSVFKPTDYSVSNLVVSNVVEHPFGDDYVIPDNIEFEFQIDFGSYYANQTITTLNGEYTTDENGVLKLLVKANESVVLKNIEEDTEIIVKQISNNVGFTVKESNEKKIIMTSLEDIKLEFVNVYKPSMVENVDVELKGTVALEGREWQEGDNFKFKLEYYNKNKKWEVVDTKVIEYNKDDINYNKFDFTDSLKKFKFDEVMVYKFRLSEVIGNLENIYYDKTINAFKIEVGDQLMDGKLEIESVKGYQNIDVVNKDGIYNISVVFNNNYEIGDTSLEYVDEEKESVLLSENIIVKNTDYTIETILSNFDGLGSDYSYTIYDKADVVQTSNIVRTGDYIKIVSNNKEYTYSIVLIGDVSGDGDISYLDYVKVYNHIQKIKNPELDKNQLYDEYLLAADMSGEGKISYLDYVKIYNKIKELKGDTE